MRTQYVGWGAIIVMWVMMSAIFVLWLFSNVILGVAVGALLGWVFSMTFLGQWIVEGMKVFRIDMPTGSLFQVGAAMGFLSSFFKFSIKSPAWDFKKGKDETKYV